MAEFGDFEFEQQVRAQQGPIGAEAIDADRATFVPATEGVPLRRDFAEQYGQDEPYYRDTTGILHGFYLPDKTPEGDERYANVAAVLGAELEADTIYAIGADNANARLWSHEFRHQGAQGMTEAADRLIDAWRADSKSEWEQVVKNWGAIVEVSEKGAEQDLLEILAEKGGIIASEEAKYDTGFSDDEHDKATKHYEEQFAYRQRLIQGS